MLLTPKGSQYRVSSPNLAKVERFPYVFRWSKPQGKSVAVSRVITTLINPCEGEMELSFAVSCLRESFNRVFRSLSDVVKSCDKLDNQMIALDMSESSHVVKAYFDCTPPIILERASDSIEVNLNKEISIADEFYVMCEGRVYECHETTIRDIMHSPLYIREGYSVRDAARLMDEKERGSILSTDENGRVVGVLTERDILKRVVAQGLDPRDVLVKQVASSPITTIECSTSIDEVAKLMTEKHIRRLPVIEAGAIVGIVTDRDLIRAIPAIFKRGS